MLSYACSVCGSKVERDLLVYMEHTEAHIVGEIKKKHPEWVEKDGVCKRCLEYYRKEMGAKNEGDRA